MENSRFKFRVWDNKDKIFLQDINIRQDGKCFCKFKGEFYYGRLSEVEQSTGLKDKNGILSYSNDVVLCRGKYWKIIHTDFGFSLKELKTGYIEGCLTYLFNFGYDEHTREDTCEPLFEVIGNIYQNKELLD